MKSTRHNMRVKCKPQIRLNGHVKDSCLMLAVDGELSPAETAVVMSHLESCWRCRTRRDEIERTIGNIVEYERMFQAAVVESRPDNTSLFLARLSALATELEQSEPAPLKRFWRKISGLVSPPLAYTTAILLVAGGVFYLTLGRKVPAVSASEVLHRAEAATETAGSQTLSTPVAVQKIQIKIGNSIAVRTVYHDLAHHRGVLNLRRTEVDAGVSGKLSGEFQKTPLDWDDPLSPAKFGDWWAAAEGREDKVSAERQGLIRLDTTAASGPIAKAAFVVRAADYHPVAEELILRDNTHLEVAELSYEVVPFASLMPNTVTAAASREPMMLPAVHTVMAVRPGAAQLAVSELAVAAALHSLGADLGEQISVQPEGNGELLVSGVVESSARQEQLAEVLKGIPFTRIAIRDLNDVAASGAPSTPVQPNERMVPIAEPARPLLAKELDARFTDQEIRSQYVNNTLALSQSASSHIWAMVWLAKHFDVRKAELLDGAQRDQLQRMVSEHAVAVHEDLRALRAQLDPFIEVGTAEAVPTDATDDWQGSVIALQASIKAANESIDTLFAGSAASRSGDAVSQQQKLSVALLQTQFQLDALDKQVRQLQPEPTEKGSPR